MSRRTPSSFDERNNASSHHGNNDDSGKRLDRRQGHVPFVPKLKHELASIESPPAIDKIHSLKDVPLRPKKQCYLSPRGF
jgi:hypothetical protein